MVSKSRLKRWPSSALAISLCLLAISAPTGVLAQSVPADAVLTKARIFTSEESNPWAEALAIKDGKVLAVGSAREISNFVGSKTEIIDAQGHLVIPGIIDARVHLSYSMKDIRNFNCTFAPSETLENLLTNIEGCAKVRKPGEWIVATSFSSTLAPQLNSAEALVRLDKISPVNPVVVRSDTIHDRWVNSIALGQANVTKDTAVSNGVIGKDPKTRELTGLLIEPGATNLVDTISPLGQFNSSDDSNLLERGATLLNSFGVTGWVDALSSVENAAAYKQVDDAGLLHGRVGISILVDPAKTAPSDLPALFASVSHNDSAHLSTRFAKIFLDGTPVSKTAFVLDPYLPDVEHGRNYRGTEKVRPDLLNAIVTTLDAMNVSVKMHVTGDASVREALDAVAAARRTNGQSGPMHTLAHAGHLASADIARFPQLNVAFEASPTMWFPGPIMDAMIAVVGKERAESFWLFRTYLNAGAFVAGGTDWKTLPGEYSDLWSGIEGMVTRRNPTGNVPGILHPEEALDVATALRLYTINSATVLRTDAVSGSLKVGKSADFVILNQDVFKINPDCISNTEPIATYFEGKIVFGSISKYAPSCK